MAFCPALAEMLGVAPGYANEFVVFATALVLQFRIVELELQDR